MEGMVVVVVVEGGGVTLLRPLVARRGVSSNPAAVVAVHATMNISSGSGTYHYEHQQW